jgi:DNA-binding transcriptional MerR regulator
MNLGEEYLTIGDVAVQFEVSSRALRFYEERGLLKPKRRGVTRLYDRRQRARIKLILRGKALGFSLTEIQHALESQVDELKSSFEDMLELPDLDKQIEELERKNLETEVAIQELRAVQSRLMSRE